MIAKHVAIIAFVTTSFIGCMSEPSQRDKCGSSNQSSNDVTETTKDASITPDPQMLVMATMSDAYIAFAEAFAAKGHVPRMDLAVDLGTSEEGHTIYVLPFETGSDTLIAAAAFEFDGVTLIDASASEFEVGGMDSGVVYRYANGDVALESLDPTLRSEQSWWACFWLNAGAGCLGATKCYWAGPGIWACVAAVCGACGAWWAVACS